jgi:anti-sigma regulatory factor (Ser/Thr protein kinase)
VGRGVTSGVRESSNSLSSRDPGVELKRRDLNRDELTHKASNGNGGTVSRTLPADLTAVREARSVVHRVLATWRADAIFDDVVLVASELVANALRHGLHIEESCGRLDGDPGPVRISLVSTGSHVICAVTDPSGEPPVRQSQDADPLAGSGRGLQLVESLSLCWGWTLLDGDREVAGVDPVYGKSVWAIFPLTLTRSAQSAQSGRAAGAA